MAGNSAWTRALILAVVACWSLPDASTALPRAPRAAAPSDAGPDAGPSMPLPSKPPCPSYVDCPWEYPKPTTKEPPSETAIGTSTQRVPALELHFQGAAWPSEIENNGAEEMKQPEVQQPVGGPSVSATQKPVCPGYATCPWDYPKPTTKAPPSNKGNDTEASAGIQSTEKPQILVEYILETSSEAVQGANAQQPMGGSVSATQKPVCPGYATCPWDYPKPTTKAPPSNKDNDTETSADTHSTGSVPLLAEHILEIESELIQETKNPGGQQSISESVSATQKPACPGYASCPWEYPKPTTKAPISNEASTIPTKDTSKLVEHFLDAELPTVSEAGVNVKEPNNGVGAASPAESKPATGNTDLIVASALGEDSESSESSGDSSEEKGNVGEENALPSHSVTEKPLCPSYAECPWDYPKPTTKGPGGSAQSPSESSEESSNSSEESGTLAVEVSNSPNEIAPDVQVPPATTSLPALPEEVVIDCSNKKDPSDAPIVNNMDESSKYSSIPIRPHTEYPFYLPGPWEYPRPTTGNPVSQKEVTDIPLVEYIGSDSNKPETFSETYITKPSSMTTLNENPGEWIFPETHKGDSSTTDSQTPEQQVNNFGSNLQGGPCPLYSSCPWQYPRPPTGSLTDTSIDSTLNQQNDKKPDNVNEEINELLGSSVQITKNPIDLANQGAFLPIYSYLYGLGNYDQGGSQFSNSRPSVLVKPESYRPSYLVNLWNYPRPFGNNDEYSGTSKESNAAATEHGVDDVNSDSIASEAS